MLVVYDHGTVTPKLVASESPPLSISHELTSQFLVCSSQWLADRCLSCQSSGKHHQQSVHRGYDAIWSDLIYQLQNHARGSMHEICACTEVIRVTSK